MSLREAIATPDGKRRYVRALFATIADQDPAFLRFIETNGLKPGQPVEVETRDTAADAVLLRGKDRRITIGARAASKLLVELER